MAEAYPSTTNLSDEDPYRSCDACTHRGLNTQAESHCTNCSENLCNNCESVHRSFKATRDHELKPLNASENLSLQQRILVSSIMKCEVHHAESLTSFCVSHDLPLCKMCSSITHRKCNKTSLKQVSKDVRVKNEVSQCTANAKRLEEAIKRLKASRGKDRDLIQDSTKTCLQKVKRLKGRIIAWAERLTKDMEDQIKHTKTKLLDEIQENMDAMTAMDKTLQGTIKSFETLGQGLEDAAFVLMKKERKHIDDSNEITKDITKHAKSVKMVFVECDKLTKIMSEITSIGKLGVKENESRTPETSPLLEHRVCFQNATVTNRNVIGEYHVTRCTFIPDGKLVIWDESNQSIKVFTKDLNLQSELKFKPPVCDVTSVSNNEVVVTQPYSKCLQVLTITEIIERKRSMPVGEPCYGIDYKHDKLYVSCHGNDGKGSVVKVLTMKGVTLNTFTIKEGSPYNLAVAVNSFGDRILVSTDQHGVQCLDNTGATLYTYRDSQLGVNRGVLFDSADNFMVCGRYTHNIHVVNRDGVKQRVILTSEDGLYGPYCLAYRPGDGTLVVGQSSLFSSEPSKLLSYTITKPN